ncbi:hypothetical protein GNY06_03005 [Elizabethkingia argentiflava]|uniref:Aspartyl protease n=1 Tax=Elizabethkingia argenteiflava TaxID=2681556 RepID=A0A845PTN9_9FLAO|nr:aspartyl protease family protein [Elizabethkingia argenteiflava]NAW50401.1 hypothetical protein [Elizabethkingia argenteiflava]
MRKTLLILAYISATVTNLLFAQMNEHSIPFYMNKDGHIIVEAKIEGIEGSFILDTGAGQNVFFKKFHNKLGVRKSCGTYSAQRSTGEILTVPIYYSEDIEIGKFSFKNQMYSTYDIDVPNIDGLISLQPFKKKL